MYLMTCDSKINLLRNVLQFIYVFSQKWYVKTILAPYMLIVFDSKSSLTHYTFDKITFLSQLHICIGYCST
jgi:hypothetical protein